MEFRSLGKTGIRVSRIGLGTVKLGRNREVKYPHSFELPDEAEVEALLEGALSLGVCLLDTAPAYGRSEERLSDFVGRHRDELVVCTKCGEEFLGDASVYDYSAKALRASVERSLRRMKLDVLDLVLLHSNGEDLRILEDTPAVETLLQLKEKGMCRSVGISAKTGEGIEAASRLLDVVMAPYSRRNQDLKEALARAHDRGTGVLAIKGLDSGHLAVGGPEEATPALEHVLGQDFVDALIVGTLKLDHLATAVEAAGLGPSTSG